MGDSDVPKMTNEEYGRHLARTTAPPLTEEQIETLARILATVEPDDQPS